MTRSASNSVEQRLAELAHGLWCEAMIDQGWTPGPRFDAAKKKHDALVPFAKLDAVDRRQTILGVRQGELISRLIECARYVREPVRELRPTDVRAGSRVQSAGDPSQRGTVFKLDLDLKWPGCLSVIHVRWNDGEVTEHVAPECELVLEPPRP